MDAQEKRRWVETIRELKGEYYMGAYPAFKFLKVRQYFEQMGSAILQGGARQNDLLVRRVGWMLEIARAALANCLDMTSIGLSTPDCCSLVTNHCLSLPVALDPDSEQAEKSLSFDHGLWVFWTADFTDCLASFWKCDALDDDLDDVRFAKALSLWTALSWRSGAIELTLTRTGKKVFYEKFATNPQYWGGEYPYEFISEMSIHHSSATQAELAAYKQAYGSNNLDAGHAIEQRIRLRRLKKGINDIVTNAVADWQSGYFAGDGWLYNSNLFDRAEREYTLGRTEIERRILLNFVHDWKSFPRAPKDHPSFVEFLHSVAHMRLQDRRERLQKLLSGDAPNLIIRNELNMIEEARYLYVAVQQNKKWLIEFLSR